MRNLEPVRLWAGSYRAGLSLWQIALSVGHDSFFVVRV